MNRGRRLEGSKLSSRLHIFAEACACALCLLWLYTLCFKKTGTLFISFIIHSNDDQFTLNFYQM